MAKSTLSVRFWAKVDVTESCWLWTGALTPGGYGNFFVETYASPQVAHRVAWELLIGPIPWGLHLDHLCRVRHCVNPDHLEPVTRLENVMRGEGPPAVNARKTHCIHGHKFTPENTYIRKDRPGRRDCRACKRARRTVQVSKPPSGGRRSRKAA